MTGGLVAIASRPNQSALVCLDPDFIGQRNSGSFALLKGASGDVSAFIPGSQ